jgi:hypothetical protein
VSSDENSTPIEGVHDMSQSQTKEGSAFFSPQLIKRARANAARYPWAAQIQRSILEGALPWLQFSDDELWRMMFGHTITRSWMVWSDGFCPACRGETPMYTWEIDAFAFPWKVRCPHCAEFFPKNDFHAYYRSALDGHGVFDPERGDRSLLFNPEHPDPGDSRYGFGVDDGEGYVEDERRWRFIGAYLVYGQWKQLILGGINHLSAAYVVSGEQLYAHKAGVLLDRIADLYPTFDFEKEGLAYERSHSTGYVSTWHDACEETRELAEAYDRIFAPLGEDGELVAFLAAKATDWGLDNPKANAADIRRNIETGILRDTLENPAKVYSNYPRREHTLATIHTVLGWPHNRDQVYALLDDILKTATDVDGVTGEKGISGYGSIGPRTAAQILGKYCRLDANFLADMLQRHPRLHQMYRFHVDTRCLHKYYPNEGDSGGFARRETPYAGVDFTRNPGLEASAFVLLGQLADLTGDAAFVQVLYEANDYAVDNLPVDLFAADPEGFQQSVALTIAREGTAPQVASIDKEEWHLAILRSGKGAGARAVCLDYDSGGKHSHADGMNLGLFAKGIDLLPDFGYPPVQYGGWDSPRARWYRMSAAHNTVVVDGQDSSPGAGHTTLWADGDCFRAIRVSGPELIGGVQFERTAALIDLTAADAYLIDIFRVVGGRDHAKFLHSHYGQITTQGLQLEPATDYGFDTQMRSFRGDPSPPPGWEVDWQIDDRFGSEPGETDIHLRYVDLSADVSASVGESWVSLGYDKENRDLWIPQLMVRRQSDSEPLSSTFVGLMEPWEGSSKLGRIRRLPLETESGMIYPDTHVALEIERIGGGRDLFVAVDMENPLGLEPAPGVVVQPEWGLRLDGELCWVRQGVDGVVQRMALCQGRSLSVGREQIEAAAYADFVETGGGGIS